MENSRWGDWFSMFSFHFAKDLIRCHSPDISLSFPTLFSISFLNISQQSSFCLRRSLVSVSCQNWQFPLLFFAISFVKQRSLFFLGRQDAGDDAASQDPLVRVGDVADDDGGLSTTGHRAAAAGHGRHGA